MILSIVACDTSSGDSGDVPDLDYPDAPGEQATPIREIDLRAALGATDVKVVGATVAPDTGVRYVLDAEMGLYEISAAGIAQQVLSLADFPPSSDVSPISGYTDIVALGGKRFALTARNDGFLLDLEAQSLRRYFCYLPNESPESNVYQMTFSVGYDADSDLLFAQPQTKTFADDTVIDSSIGRYSADTGADLEWFDMPKQYSAGGIAVVEAGEIVLGRGDKLDRFTLADGALKGAVDLAPYGVDRISGLAIDKTTETILVVDATNDSLLELPLLLVQ